MAVVRAFERVAGIERAHTIIADAWRKYVYEHRLLERGTVATDPVAKALFDLMDKLDEAKKEDDSVWRAHRFPPPEEPAAPSEPVPASDAFIAALVTHACHRAGIPREQIKDELAGQAREALIDHVRGRTGASRERAEGALIAADWDADLVVARLTCMPQ